MAWYDEVLSCGKLVSACSLLLRLLILFRFLLSLPLSGHHSLAIPAGMSPIRKTGSRFRFVAGVDVNAGFAAHVDIKIPSAPWRVRDALPTITRTFRARSESGRRKGKNKRLKSNLDSDSEELDGNDSEEPASRTSTPGFNDNAAPSSIAHDGKPDVFVDFDTQSYSTRNKGKTRAALVRYPSVTSIASNDDRPTSRQGSVSSVRSSSRPAATASGSGSETYIWTRFGMQNGEPVFIRQWRNSSTIDKDCITYWWESSSRTPLQEPPDLSDRPDLALGDLYCNRVAGIDVPQLWIWTTDGWKTIAEGDVRESDHRRLSITPKKKLPSWVKAEWCIKQMVKHHKGELCNRTNLNHTGY
ncbi:hypothetical protein NUW54_g4404 [Trametes sanguinea]|uniref:Uncharacterized protein n=1 Tax=Trametes sanguinea TaxID=158606 RepID=A0ACC1Q0S9_9APHY|nr:hypothetical protein NUW54_g4404 [Trametes sanguinea]